MKFSFWIVAGLSTFGLGGITAAYGQEPGQHAVDVAISSAERVCLSGDEFKFDLKANGDLTIKKLSPTAETEIHIDKKNTRGGVFFQDPEVRKLVEDRISNCMERQWPQIIRFLIPEGKKSCRIRENGVERYTREFDVSRQSPEMGGGHSQPEWCNNLTAALRGDFPDGNFTQITSSESSRSGCAPFNCPLYTYQCTIHVQADPIFIEKVSDRCP